MCSVRYSAVGVVQNCYRNTVVAVDKKNERETEINLIVYSQARDEEMIPAAYDPDPKPTAAPTKHPPIE
jgi:hypothetical protein